MEPSQNMVDLDCYRCTKLSCAVLTNLYVMAGYSNFGY